MNAVSVDCEFAAPASAGRRAAVKHHAPMPESRLLCVFTLVLWVGCASVAALGFALSYPLPQAKAAEPMPVQAEFLNVELSSDPQLILDASPRVAATEQIPLPSAPAALPLPVPAIALNETAFVVPEPVLQSSAEAVNLTPTTAVAQTSNVGATQNAPAGDIETIVFGRGDGRQPAPEYPFQAQRQGQQGTVQIRFLIGENGRILDAEVAEPSPWPLLNASALKTVRHTWRFSPGKPRLCQVCIHFTL